MARVRMSWNWVGEWPIFVYTTFITHNVFRVKLVKGTKGDQNDPAVGPWSPAWKQYTQKGLASKDAVVELAFTKAHRWLKEEAK